MTIPGFTAEVTAVQSRSQSLGGRSIQRDRPKTDTVILAANWGSIADNGCQAGGTYDARHKYSAILWNVPSGQSWEAACHSTPGPAGTPVANLLPTNCVTGLNEWGEWYLPDNHCPRQCPPECYAASVACSGALLWNTCWCPNAGQVCPEGGWWVGGVCVGLWQNDCIP
jgi:hypothetical protein